jgi:outer membrane protein TolC
LTASIGFQSAALTSLSLAPPIFTGGRIKSGVRLAEARQKELVLSYRQTIQQAFRGSDARYREGAASYLEVLRTRQTPLMPNWAWRKLDCTVENYRNLGGSWES